MWLPNKNYIATGISLKTPVYFISLYNFNISCNKWYAYVSTSLAQRCTFTEMQFLA